MLDHRAHFDFSSARIDVIDHCHLFDFFDFLTFRLFDFSTFRLFRLFDFSNARIDVLDHRNLFDFFDFLTFRARTNVRACEILTPIKVRNSDVARKGPKKA